MTEWSKDIFAKNLEYYIKKNNITQKELAEAIGVSSPALNDWIKGKKFPRIDKIEKLADYFKILKSDLIEDKAKMRANNDIIADIIVRLRSDSDFFNLVETMYKLDNEKIAGVKNMLAAFSK